MILKNFLNNKNITIINVSYFVRPSSFTENIKNIKKLTKTDLRAQVFNLWRLNTQLSHPNGLDTRLWDSSTKSFYVASSHIYMNIVYFNKETEQFKTELAIFDSNELKQYYDNCKDLNKNIDFVIQTAEYYKDVLKQEK